MSGIYEVWPTTPSPGLQVTGINDVWLLKQQIHAASHQCAYMAGINDAGLLKHLTHPALGLYVAGKNDVWLLNICHIYLDSLVAICGWYK